MDDNNNPPKKASVIILTGFLGAGKTTLLNRILTADHGRRIAVIVNEFGEVGIDHHLLISSDQQVVQMNNGCICCTVRGDLVRSFFELAEHRSKFDTVVIETTGLAEPAPVAQSLYADERIRREFTLEGVVTIVDAKYISGQLEESAEACEQIAFADLILLNKTDLAAPEELDEIEKDIGRLNKVAKVHRTRNSEMDLSAVFDLGSADLAQKIDAHAAHHDHHHHDGDHHHHHHHNHLRNIETVCIVEPGALDGMKVSLWFRSLITEFGADILRMKGILNLRGDPDQFLFQGVHTEFEGKPGRAWSADEERVNRLVFIGRKLDQEKITRGFEGCFFTGTQDDVRDAGSVRPQQPGILTLHARSDQILDAAEFRVPHGSADRHQGGSVRQTGLPADRNRDHGDPEERASAPVQGAAADQRDHLRSRLRPDRKSDAVLLKTRAN